MKNEMRTHPSSDLISREDAKQQISEWATILTKPTMLDKDATMVVLDTLPSPDRPTDGEWLTEYDYDSWKRGYEQGKLWSKAEMEREASIEAVQGWIPCSERLPKEDDRYLVTYPLMNERNWISIKWFGKPNMPNRPIKEKCFYESHSEYGDVIWDNVTAWMPLPTPYKGGDTE